MAMVLGKGAKDSIRLFKEDSLARVARELRRPFIQATQEVRSTNVS